MSAATPTQHTTDPAILRRATIGAALGSVVEWFDVAVYAYLATTIGAVFFPEANETAQRLSSFAIFGVAFVVRPLGGVFFGHLGDKVGRQKTLAWVIILVSGATVGIGLLPSYDSIGITAPILLVALRLLQGFSAGGEMGGASAFVAEHSPPHRRGYLVSWVEMGCIAGFLLGSIGALVLGLSLSDAQLTSWGWRIPFLMAAPLGIAGLYIRSRLEETPEFEALQEQKEVSRNPLVEVLVHHWPAVLRTAGFALFQNAALYVIVTYVPSHLSDVLGYSSDLSGWSAVITMTVICALIPVAGGLSDRIGRKPLLMASCVISLITAWPLFALMETGPVMAVLSQACLGGILALFLGVTLTAMNELFTTEVRYGGFSIGYNISVALFGGAAPFLVTWLGDKTGSTVMPAFYIMAAAVVTTVVVLLTRETAPARQATAQ